MSGLKKIDLQTALVYGPVSSRRLGKSLGINPILPGTKVCTFNCVYCQYEARSPFSPSDVGSGEGFADLEAIRRKLTDTLLDLKGKGERIDYITFAGNGEPTLHPDFPDLVDITLKLRDSIYQGTGTAILTNGSMLVDEKVRRAVKLLDRAIVKLDAATLSTLLKVNRPYKGFELDKLLPVLSEMDNLVIQTLFLGGKLTNAGENVDAWIETMKLIEPRGVQIYSLDRVPAEDDILPLAGERLDAIARRLEDETGIPAEVY